MLKNITPSECAQCRLCCIFDKYDVWETPVISAELKARIETAHPGMHFVSKGDSGAYIFNMENTWDEEEELYFCPALDRERGCILGENKPFDCKVWPYRIMRLGGALVISIASICPVMYKKPLDTLVKELEDGLAEKIFREAEMHPQIVKPYEQGYPILMVKEKETKDEDNQTLI